jgi:hypothetical protein
LTPFSALIFAVNDPQANAALALEEAVFLKEFGNTAEQLDDEYGPYRNYSFILCVMDNLNHTVAGMTRIIVQNDEVGLKSINDIAQYWPEISLSEPPLSERNIWDIGTLAIAEAYQTPMSAGLIGLGLYQSAIRIARHFQIDTLIALLDSIVHRLTRWKYHAPFQIVPGAIAKPYLGSKATFPVYSRISVWDENLRAKDPSIHEIIYTGKGIEAALSPLTIEHGVPLIQELQLL